MSSPIDHLRRTVQAHEHAPDDKVMATATGWPIGLTMRDLRVILAWLELSQDNLYPDHPAFNG